MTARGTLAGLILGTTMVMVAGCAQTVGGTAVRSAPGVDDESRSPVDVDGVLLDRAQMQAITGGGEALTPIPGMESKYPVDIDLLAETVPAQCQWVFKETQVFGSDVEEFHKTSYQDPPRGALISQAAAGYRDASTAERSFADLVARVQACGRTGVGAGLVGDVSGRGDRLLTRPGGCGRDYRVKTVVLIEVTFCAFPESVPDIVVTNMAARVPG